VATAAREARATGRVPAARRDLPPPVEQLGGWPQRSFPVEATGRGRLQRPRWILARRPLAGPSGSGTVETLSLRESNRSQLSVPREPTWRLTRRGLRSPPTKAVGEIAEILPPHGFL